MIDKDPRRERKRKRTTTVRSTQREEQRTEKRNPRGSRKREVTRTKRDTKGRGRVRGRETGDRGVSIVDKPNSSSSSTVSGLPAASDLTRLYLPSPLAAVGVIIIVVVQCRYVRWLSCSPCLSPSLFCRCRVSTLASRRVGSPPEPSTSRPFEGLRLCFRRCSWPPGPNGGQREE